MKVEQKFIVTIKDSPFELSKQEAESLYYELQKVNIPFQNPYWDNPTIEPFRETEYDWLIYSDNGTFLARKKRKI